MAPYNGGVHDSYALANQYTATAMSMWTRGCTVPAERALWAKSDGRGFGGLREGLEGMKRWVIDVARDKGEGQGKPLSLS